MKRVISSFVAALTMGILVSGCGSSNSNGVPEPQKYAAPPSVGVPSSGGSGNNSGSIDYEQGAFKGIYEFLSQCENPVDSYEKQGSRLAEQHFIRELLNDIYYWYEYVPDVNPKLFDSPLQAFFSLIAGANFAQNPDQETDRFSGVISQVDYQAVYVKGESASYGAFWVYGNRGADDSEKALSVKVAYVTDGSPADEAGLRRGDTLTKVNGRELASVFQAADKDAIVQILSRSDRDQELTISYKHSGENTLRTTKLTSKILPVEPIHQTAYFSTERGTAGYLVYNTFTTDRASSELISALTEFRDNGIDDLILDLRYNSGGLVKYANQLASMIAGASNSKGKVFVRAEYNDKYQDQSPFGPDDPLESYFVQKAENNADLPSLNLSRVFVLTTGETCSASELVMNSLRGIDIEVIQIGGTTCGKPYAFAGIENCEWVYFPVQSLEVNAKGFGDYTDGFTATGTPTALDQIKGCPLADDLDSPLGSQNEDLLATALHYIDNNNCNAALATGNAFKPQATPVEYTSGKPAWQKAMYREMH